MGNLEVLCPGLAEACFYRSYSLEKKLKINDIKVHKSRTFFTPSVSDVDNLYFVELIFFLFLFFSEMALLNNFIFFTLSTLKSVKKYFVSTIDYVLSNYGNWRQILRKFKRILKPFFKAFITILVCAVFEMSLFLHKIWGYQSLR